MSQLQLLRPCLLEFWSSTLLDADELAVSVVALSSIDMAQFCDGLLNRSTDTLYGVSVIAK